MISKINFADWYVLQGKSFEVARPILGMFFNVYNQQVFQTLVGAECCTVSGEIVDPFGQIVTGLVGGLWLDLW